MSIVSCVTNTHFVEDDSAWMQATLPIKMGGLGFRCTRQLASSAFLSSAAASQTLVHRILPLQLRSLPTPNWDSALSLCSQGHDNPMPTGTAAFHEGKWDVPRSSATVESLLDNAPDDRVRARLLAASVKESGS